MAANKTQAQVADEAGIDRSRYNALENGRHPITATYAERLATVFGERNPKVFLPPPPSLDGVTPVRVSPIDRLAALEAEVSSLRAEHEAALQGVVVRLAELEAALANQAQRSTPTRTAKARRR